MKKIFIFLLVSFFVSCSTDVDVTAPPKDILVVYSVLTPTQPINYVRVAKAWLTDDDAIKYAATQDLSVQNAIVTLTEYTFPTSGTNLIQTNQFTLTPDPTFIKEPGDFNQAQTIFKTSNLDTIRPGRLYALNITIPGNENLKVTAHTTIPSQPLITTPGDKVLASGTNYQYPTYELDSDPELKFYKGKKITTDLKEKEIDGFSYEARVYFEVGYKNGTDTTWLPEFRFGPTELSNENDCVPGNSTVMCQRFGTRSVLQYLKSKLNDDTKNYVIRQNQLAKSTRVEVTSVDTFLVNYMTVNNPKYTDFNSIKPEYTNINGGKGVLGSYNTHSRYVLLNECTKYLLKLNETAKPATKCDPL